ncbi:MAG: hypothetical protein WC996_03645 [Peptostreptococcales bacterium]
MTSYKLPEQISKNQKPIYGTPVPQGPIYNVPGPQRPVYNNPNPNGPLPTAPIQRPLTPVQRPYDIPIAPVPVVEVPPQPIDNILFTQGYLKANIGRYIKAEFLIGTSSFIDREGVLLEVGTSYFIIQEPETDDLVLCDIYSLKFVRFFY